MKCRYTFICAVLTTLLLVGNPAWGEYTTTNGFTAQGTINPYLQLEDTNINHADWFLLTNWVSSETFSIYNMETTSNPFVIENGTASNLLYLDSAERIGINDGSPSWTLDVVGSGIYVGDADTPTKNIIIRVNGTDADLETTTSDLYIRTPSANELLLKPYDTYPEVGIGTTIPSWSLDINSTQPVIRLDDTSTGAGSVLLSMSTNEFAIRGNTGLDIVEIDSRAPAHSLTIDDNNGRVGLGTQSPGANLHIYSGATLDTFAGMGPDVVNGPGFNYGYAGSSFGRGAGFFNVRPDASATGVNPSLRFMTINQQRMIVTNAGNVGIGTTGPSSRLHVNGGDIRVSGGSFIDDGTTLNVPDYVFDDGYKLRPLSDLKSYIETEKHLPGVKNAEAIAEQGLNLSESHMVLLEKIEELTLYTLQQQAELDNKKQQLSSQEERLARLESMVSRINQAENKK